MSEQNKIKTLRDHICKLNEEIAEIDIKNPKLGPEEYLSCKTQLQTLKNLRAIARNELNSLLHQYRFTISGKIIGSKGQIFERVVRTRVFSDINCTIVSPATITGPEDPEHLISLVRKDYSTYFLEGKFEIKRIKKIR